MTIAPDAWLSATLGRPSYSVHAGDAAADIVKTIHAHEAPADAFYFAKVPVLNVESIKALEGVGFSVVETSLTFSRPTGGAAEADEAGSSRVDLYRPEWKNAVLDIAEHAFRYTRFHVDPDIGLTAANRVKREWIQSYVEGRRGDCLLVAHEAGTVVGFNAMLATERSGDPVTVIDLIGVHPDHQKRRIGARMIDAADRHYRSRYATMEVTTQASNVPSVRLYERLGFRLIRSTVVLHRHGPA